jgi:hypothetical protein
LNAAVSIRTVPHGSVRQERRQRASNFTAQAMGEHTAAVFTLPSRGTEVFPRDFSSKTCGAGFVLGRGRSSRRSKRP